MSDKKERVMHIILCCGNHGRAVVFGETKKKPVTGQPVKLVNARMVLYWSSECGGLFGLATKGPKKGTRITEALPQLVETVWQEWMELTPVAVEGLTSWPSC